jgi:hypothetical protein
MDAARFDRLTRALVRIPRRTVLQGLLSVGLAVGTGVATTPSASACSRVGRRCGNGRGRCCGSLKCCDHRCRKPCAANEARTPAPECGCCRLINAPCGASTPEDPFGADACCSGACQEFGFGGDACVACLPGGARCDGRGPCCPDHFCDGVTEKCQHRDA